MTQTAQLSLDVGNKVLAAWAKTTGRVCEGEEAKQGLLALLWKAEQAAITKGWAVAVPTDSGAAGYIVGGATDAAKAAAAAGDDLAIVYLAAQNAARLATAEITTLPATTNALDLTTAEGDSYDIEPTIAPLAIAITIAIVAVAVAVVAVAWAVQTKVAVEAQTQQRTALVNSALDAASSNNPNIRNNPQLWSLLNTMAGQETAGVGGGFPWGAILMVGGAVVVGKLVLDHVRGDR